MTSYPALRRCLVAGVSLSAVAVAVALGALARRPAEPDPVEQPKAGTWPMWGGTLSRNMVNALDTNILAKWNVTGDKMENVLWTADLGSKAYGGPVVADGKIFVGTNNQKPRDPKVVGDKGIVMCFEEKTGKFLAARPRQAAGQAGQRLAAGG